MGAFKTVMEAIEQPGYKQEDIDARRPYVMAVGAPSYPDINKILVPEIQRIIPDKLRVGKYHETKKELKLRGRAGLTVIYFITAGKISSWYGISLYRAWVDEFAQIKETMFDEVCTRLMDTQGKLFLTGTPHGPNWAFERIFKPWSLVKDWKEGRAASPDPGIMRIAQDIDFFTWRTIDNPYIPAEEIESKRITMPKRYFNRTFLATWDSFAGQVYEEFNRKIHIVRKPYPRFVMPSGRKLLGGGEKVVRIQRVIGGVDWGFAPGHSGVLHVWGKDYAGRWWLLDEICEEGVLIVSSDPMRDSWVKRALGLQAKWGVSQWYADTGNPEGITQFRSAGVRVRGAVKEVKAGIEVVARYMHPNEETGEPSLFMLSYNRDTIDEVQFYHWKENKEEPEKVGDNCCDAMRYAIYTDELAGKFDRELKYSA